MGPTQEALALADFLISKYGLAVDRYALAYAIMEHEEAAIRAEDSQQPAEAVAVEFGPIERDEQMDRTYIPMPGGWEIQTKGKGSTFRICDPQGERLPIPESPYLHETLERMAREVHAAARETNTPAIDIGKLRELGKRVETLAYRQHRDGGMGPLGADLLNIANGIAALIGDGGRTK